MKTLLFLKKMVVLLSAAVFFSGTASAEEVTISNKYLTVTIDSFGAELQSMTANGTGREYLWHGDPDHWERRAPVMFPVAVRMKDNEFRYDKKNYEMPSLGFAKDSEFQVAASDQESASFILESNGSTKEFYPFDFRFTVTYRLVDRELKNEFLVENLGKKTMYYAMGGHPAFVLPLEDGKEKTDFAFTFPKPVTAERMVIEKGLVGRKTERFLKKDSVLNMDDERIPGSGMLIESKLIKKVGIAEQGGKPFLEMDLGTFPYINLSMQKDKPFICLEPLVGHHDTLKASSSIDKKEALLTLPKGGSADFWYSVIILPEE